MRSVLKSNTFLTIKDEYGEVVNEPVLVVGATGYGKGLCLESCAEDYHNNGYIVIVIADPKNEVEFGFQMFKPKAKYHLDYLRAINKEPRAKKVKIYHPFSFDIPKNYLSNYNFYTIPLKDLGKHEWGLIAETHAENESVSLLLKASEEITNEDGIVAFAHYIQDSIKGKLKNRKRVADWKNFGVEAGSGTMKELSRITNYIRPFRKHFFLSKNNSKHNLNWEKILTDQEYYHVFTTNFLDFNKDEKTMGLIVLHLLEGIIRNKKYLKRPVCIVCPELKYICPFKGEGFRQFLADSFTKALSTIRSTGKGMTFLGDTQNWGGLDKGIKDVIKVTLLGQLSGNDIEEVSKKWFFNKEYKEFFRKPPRPNTFLIAESDIFQPFTFFLPSAMHCEPKYTFSEMYKEHYRKDPENFPLVKYDSLIKEMREEYKREEDKFKEKVKKKERKEESEELQKVQEKEEKKIDSDKVIQKTDKLKQKESILKENIQKQCYDAYQKLNSYRKVAEKFKYLGVGTHVTAKKYIELYEKKLEEDKEIDYEDKVIEDLSID